MISTTLGELANAEPALKRLSEIRLPIKVAYQLGKLIRLAGVELADYHTRRDTLIRQLGEPNPADPTQVIVTPANMPEFVKDMTSLGGEPVELSTTPLSIDSLGDIDITPIELLTLMPLMTEEPHAEPSHTPQLVRTRASWAKPQ